MPNAAPHIMPAHSKRDVAAVGELFLEYAQGLGFGLEFQDFEKELAQLPGRYGPPSGRLLLARVGSQPAGCVALRMIEAGVCEMKRLYVREGHRGQGIGRQLAAAIIAEAVAMHYQRMRLDTVPSMTQAIALYRELGFRVIPPYYYNPIADAVFMELTLG